MLEKIKLCEKCHTAWLYEFTHHDKYHKNGYKINCLCGDAWINSKWQPTKKEVIDEWNGDKIYTLSVSKNGSEFEKLVDGTLEQCGSLASGFVNDGYEIKITKSR